MTLLMPPRLIGLALLAAAAPGPAPSPSSTGAPPLAVEPMQPDPFAPTWESLAKYQVPEWFRDAKFGIWAHWGPQCEPEQGDWYARQHVQARAAATTSPRRSNTAIRRRSASRT